MKKFLTLFLMLSLIFTAGCGGKEETKKEQLPKITIGLMPDVDSLPFVIAEENGYFDDEGLKVQIEMFKSAMDRDAAIQSGNLDGAVSDLLAVAFLRSGGFPVKVTSSTDGSYQLIAGKNEKAREVKDLVSKDVAVSRNTIIEYVTDEFLFKNNLKDDSINKVIIPQIPTRLEMLQNGKLAAATLPEPFASIAVDKGCHLVVSSEAIGVNPGVMIFKEDVLKEKEKSVLAMYKAYNRAIEYLNTAPREEYINVATEKGGFPPAAKDALKLPKYRKADLPKEEDVNSTVKWLNMKSLVNENYTYKDFVSDLIKNDK